MSVCGSLESQIHWLISTRVRTVLGARLAAAALSEGLREVLRAAGLRGNGSVTKRSFFTFIFHAESVPRGGGPRGGGPRPLPPGPRGGGPRLCGNQSVCTKSRRRLDSADFCTGLCGGAPRGGGPRGGGPLGGGPRGGGPRGGPPMVFYARGCPLVPSGCIRSETRATAGYASLETVPSPFRQRQWRAPAYAPKNLAASGSPASPSWRWRRPKNGRDRRLIRPQRVLGEVGGCKQGNDENPRATKSSANLASMVCDSCSFSGASEDRAAFSKSWSNSASCSVTCCGLKPRQ